MAGNDLRLCPGRSVRVAPELCRTVIALQVAGTDAGGLDLYQRLTWSRLGDWYLLQLIVLGPVADNGLHRFGYLGLALVGRGFGHVSLHAPSRNSELVPRRPAQSGR